MKILAGIDLNTDTYSWLVGRASFFAEYVGGKLDLFFALSPDQESQADHFRQRLASILESIPEACRGEALIATGNPVDAMLEHAESYDALVVGPREPGAFEALLFGSIASRVVKRCRCAVYTPRFTGREQDTHHRVLLAVDLTRGSNALIGQQVGQWLARINATVDLLYADKQSLPHISDPKVRERAMNEWQVTRKHDLEKLKAFVASQLPEHCAGVIRVEQGDPADVLVNVSSAYDLIIVGSKPREGLSGVVFGSIASQLVREANCDILTLPTSQDL